MSLAVTSVIAIFVISFGSSLTSLVKTSGSDVTVALDASFALDTIATDLENAVFLELGSPMLAVSALSHSTTIPGEFDRTLSGFWQDATMSGRPTDLDFNPATDHYGWAGSWLRFFTTAPSMNAVGYQIIRREAFDDTSGEIYALYRAVVRNDHTLVAGYDITDVAYGVIPPDSTSTVQAGRITKPTRTLILQENVIDFGVRLYVYESEAITSLDSPKGLRLIYPSTDFETLSSGDREHVASTAVGTTWSDRYPDVVEIFIRVLSEEGAALLHHSQEVAAGMTYDDIVAEHGKIYRRMVKVASGGR